MRIDPRDLQSVKHAPEPLPPAVEPHLALAEEVVLLSLDAARGRVRDAVAIAASADDAGPEDYGAAVSSLEDRGLVERVGLRRQVRATNAAKLAERRKRVLAVIRRAAVPTGSDAELLVLLAACRALSLGREDYLHARVRVTSIREDGAHASAVEVLRVSLGADSMADLAEALLPAAHDLRNANFDPGIGTAYMAGGLNC